MSNELVVHSVQACASLRATVILLHFNRALISTALSP